MAALSEKQTVALFLLSAVFFVACMLIASSVLPEHCVLFGSNTPGPLICDSFKIGDPQPCPVCRDQRTALVAQLIAGFGTIMLVQPSAVSFLKRRRERQLGAEIFSGSETQNKTR